MVIPPDRRRSSHTRFPMRVQAVTEAAGTPGDPKVGEARDLSRSGVGLRLGKALVPGAPVRVTLRLRRRPALTLVGSVAWLRPHPDFPGWALGVRFDDELPGEMVLEIADEEHPPWQGTRR